jgi:hypothetical protein
MRLSEWRRVAPDPDVLGRRARSTIDPVLTALGAESDPHALPVWGEDAARRFSLYVLSPTGLIGAGVRFDLPGEPPRVTARLIRWSKLQLSELAAETNGTHRVVSVTIDGQVFRAPDEAGDRIAAFVRAIHALEEGRPLPDLGDGPTGSPAGAEAPVDAAAPGPIIAGAPTRSVVPEAAASGAASDGLEVPATAGSDRPLLTRGDEVGSP